MPGSGLIEGMEIAPNHSPDGNNQRAPEAAATNSVVGNADNVNDHEDNIDPKASKEPAQDELDTTLTTATTTSNNDDKDKDNNNNNHNYNNIDGAMVGKLNNLGIDENEPVLSNLPQPPSTPMTTNPEVEPIHSHPMDDSSRNEIPSPSHSPSKRRRTPSPEKKQRQQPHPETEADHDQAPTTPTPRKRQRKRRRRSGSKDEVNNKEFPTSPKKANTNLRGTTTDAGGNGGAKSITSKDPSPAPDEEKEHVPNDQTWQDWEITVYDPNDPDDDGEGLCGVGFRSSALVETTREFHRKMQVMGYHRRIGNEERGMRKRKREQGKDAAGNAEVRADNGDDHDGDDGGPVSGRKGVRFSTADEYHTYEHPTKESPETDGVTL